MHAKWESCCLHGIEIGFHGNVLFESDWRKANDCWWEGIRATYSPKGDGREMKYILILWQKPTVFECNAEGMYYLPCLLRVCADYLPGLSVMLRVCADWSLMIDSWKTKLINCLSSFGLFLFLLSVFCLPFHLIFFLTKTSMLKQWSVLYVCPVFFFFFFSWVCFPHELNIVSWVLSEARMLGWCFSVPFCDHAEQLVACVCQLIGSLWIVSCWMGNACVSLSPSCFIEYCNTWQISPQWMYWNAWGCWDYISDHHH